MHPTIAAPWTLRGPRGLVILGKLFRARVSNPVHIALFTFLAPHSIRSRLLYSVDVYGRDALRPG